MSQSLFFNRVQPQTCSFIKNKTPTHVFYCEIYEHIKSTFFNRTLGATATSTSTLISLLVTQCASLALLSPYSTLTCLLVTQCGCLAVLSPYSTLTSLLVTQCVCLALFSTWPYCQAGPDSVDCRFLEGTIKKLKLYLSFKGTTC